MTPHLEHLPLATPRFRAVRGAVTVTTDSPAAIDAAVRTLLDELTEANAIESCDIVSAIFSATPDLHSRNPATAARSLGWTDVPLMCVAELETDGMLPRCVRVLLHVSVTDGRRLQPVYLGEAACLRPDLHAGTATRSGRRSGSGLAGSPCASASVRVVSHESQGLEIDDCN